MDKIKAIEASQSVLKISHLEYWNDGVLKY